MGMRPFKPLFSSPLNTTTNTLPNLHTTHFTMPDSEQIRLHSPDFQFYHDLPISPRRHLPRFLLHAPFTLPSLLQYIRSRSLTFVVVVDLNNRGARHYHVAILDYSPTFGHTSTPSTA